MSGADIAAIDIAAKGTLSEERGENFPLRCGGQGAAKGLEVPGQLIGIDALAVAGMTARSGQMLNHLDPRLSALAVKQGRITVRANTRQNTGKTVAPGVDKVDMHGQHVPRLAAFDINRPDHGVVFGRIGDREIGNMGIIHKLMDNRVIAVVLDQTRKRILGLHLKDFTGLDPQDGLVPVVEGVSGHLAALDFLHTGPPYDCSVESRRAQL